MLAFRYRAIDAEGRPVRGVLAAEDPDDLDRRLAGMGLDLLRASRARAAPGPRRRRGASRRELIHFCFHLEQLASAGIPLLEALRDLADSLEHPGMRRVVHAVAEAIEGGRNLSQSLEQHPQVFDEIFVSLIRAGEQAGRLPEVLADLAAQLRWEDELAAQTRKLALYPLFVAVVVVAVTAFLVLHLVPQMAGLILNLGRELPLQTQLLLALSGFVVEHGWVVLLVATVPPAALAVLARNDDRFAEAIDRCKLGLPLLGPLYGKIALARFASSFALLYASGITVLEALRQCESIVGNRVLRGALEAAGRAVADGKSLATALADTALVPALVVRMLRIGEQTGAIDTALRNVNYFYNREVREAVGVLQALIEPVLTVALGAVLAAVMFAVLGPVYDTMTALKW